MKSTVVLQRVLAREPVIFGSQSQGVLNQAPTLATSYPQMLRACDLIQTT